MTVMFYQQREIALRTTSKCNLFSLLKLFSTQLFLDYAIVVAATRNKIEMI